MKPMTCKQLGGACDQEFQANSFDEIAEMSKQHGMQMFQENDAIHLKAMDQMRELMQTPQAMADWFETKRCEFETLADS
jgi:predicted small metal-binding protein